MMAVLSRSESLSVGRTPLLDLTPCFPLIKDATKILAKAEWHNPGGSVKDRAALRIVQDAERAGLLQGKTLLDATSGNTGIAYAWICARLGIKLSLAVPGSQQVAPSILRGLRRRAVSPTLKAPTEPSEKPASSCRRAGPLLTPPIQ